MKVSNAHLRSTDPSPEAQVPQLGPLDDRRRSELLGAAAAAEGGFEALPVRITFEHYIDPDQRAALWCLRSAYKQLRRAMLDGEPLLWWRSDIHGSGAGRNGYRAYKAFKNLTSLVADMLLTEPNTPAPPAVECRFDALRQVTSSGDEGIKDGRISPAIEREREERRLSRDRAQQNWEWLVAAEQLLGIRYQPPSPNDQAVAAPVSSHASNSEFTGS